MATQPRSFKLLDEYDNSIGKGGCTLIKGKHHGMINYGLKDDDDIVSEPAPRRSGVPGTPRAPTPA